MQTDHQPLKWLFSLKEPNQRVMRWKTLISKFEFDIQYIKGQDNKVADFLSREQHNHQVGEGNFEIYTRCLKTR